MDTLERNPGLVELSTAVAQLAPTEPVAEQAPLGERWGIRFHQILVERGAPIIGQAALYLAQARQAIAVEAVRYQQAAPDLPLYDRTVNAIQPHAQEIGRIAGGVFLQTVERLEQACDAHLPVAVPAANPLQRLRQHGAALLRVGNDFLGGSIITDLRAPLRDVAANTRHAMRGVSREIIGASALGLQVAGTWLRDGARDLRQHERVQSALQVAATARNHVQRALDWDHATTQKILEHPLTWTTLGAGAAHILRREPREIGSALAQYGANFWRNARQLIQRPWAAHQAQPMQAKLAALPAAAPIGGWVADWANTQPGYLPAQFGYQEVPAFMLGIASPAQAQASYNRWQSEANQETQYAVLLVKAYHDALGTLDEQVDDVDSAIALQDYYAHLVYELSVRSHAQAKQVEAQRPDQESLVHPLAGQIVDHLNKWRGLGKGDDLRLVASTHAISALPAWVWENDGAHLREAISEALFFADIAADHPDLPDVTFPRIIWTTVRGIIELHRMGRFDSRPTGVSPQAYAQRPMIQGVRVE